MGAFYFSSLAIGKFECNFRYITFKEILVIDGWGISCDIALIRMSITLDNVDSDLCRHMASLGHSVLNPAWTSNCIHYKMWDEFTYPFTNFNDTVVEDCEWKSTLSYTLLRMWLLISAGIRSGDYA